METAQLELIKKIHEVFKSKKLHLSIGESCTAGLISHMVTSPPGASEFFDSAIICYSMKSKEKLSGIKRSLLRKYGAVSEETAEAMSEAIRTKTKTDFTLAITGNLGPQPIEGKKIGLVFMSVSSDDRTESKGMIFDGSRDEIKQAAAMAALEFLYEVILVWT